ncbi:MAG: NfeD family protein [Rikenellaceae bacterium]
MESWIIWGIVALVALIVEIFTTGIAVICFSVGAAGAMVVAFCGGGTTFEVATFAVVSLLALVLLRPFIIKWVESRSSQCATNVDALVGRVASVTQRFELGEGRVSVDGDDWKAVCDDVQMELEVADRVEIVAVNSVVLTVKKV